MAKPISKHVLLRFGAFELDLRSGELRKDGEIVKLTPQPFKVLTLLARRSGEVVSRDEMRQQIWCGDTFVDFDQGLNFCIRQIREALGDDADAPQYIETLPRRGYRFLLPLETESGADVARAPLTRLIVLPFRMLRPDTEMDFLAFSVPDAITSSLAGLESMVVRSNIVASRFAGEVDPKALATEADVDVVLSGSLLRSGDRLRVSTQLTEVPGGKLLWAHTSEVALGDIFQIQDELATRIVNSLALPLTVREQTLLKRDVPSSARAYELYLRGNQLSRDPKQWEVARDFYRRCVEADPGYAPAWARLGRIHHVMAKWLGTDATENLERAGAAFKRALEINPDHPLAHKFFAQLDIDFGRAEEAMARLLRQARTADPEVFAGLVSACRYCGLLDAATAADARARHLDSRVSTSAVHIWFLRGDHARVIGTKLEENPYIVLLSFAAVDRTAEAIARARELERKIHTRKRDFTIVARTLLEGKTEESIAAANRIAASDFCDPEGLFYMARHLIHLEEIGDGINLFRRVVEGGYCCFPAMTDDPWLDPARATPKFRRLLRQAETRHRQAVSTFDRVRGDAVLGAGSHR
ncbi:MAG TPA: winged helix-turn-helix domain-containing protein [Vicinamibacterales bacterium]|jgi:DNA-binding winged helix-turn-helix (wHTH) protein/tetratricopeptide (TPR) repeat protein|nr:winged helix-turn-helix domain-containing protein [Vicinamibacterales bacterium]